MGVAADAYLHVNQKRVLLWSQHSMSKPLQLADILGHKGWYLREGHAECHI